VPPVHILPETLVRAIYQRVRWFKLRIGVVMGVVRQGCGEGDSDRAISNEYGHVTVSNNALTNIFSRLGW